MAKKTYAVNFRVIVEPVEPWLTKQTDPRYEEIMRSRCRDLEVAIKRHVDDVQGVHMECDYESVCEHCGRPWAEDGDAYNGGCCAEDQEPEEAKATGA